MTGVSTDHAEGCPDLELLAALVDGRLDPAERGRVLAHLESCERCYEIWTETLLLREEESATGEVVVLPGAPGRRGWWVAAALAAALTGILVWTPAVDLLRGRPVLTAKLEVGGLAARVGAGAGSFAAEGWQRVRSGDAYVAGLGERQRSFRLGLRLVDLEVALRSGEVEEARQRLPEIEQLAGSFELPELLVASYADLARRLGSGEPTEALLVASARADEYAAGVVAEPLWFAFGKWAEAGRMAAESGDRRLLQGRPFRSFPDRLESEELAPRLSAALTRVQARLGGDLTGDEPAALADDFAAIATLGANR